MLTTLGVLLLVPDALFIRLIEAEALAIAFWRGLIAGGLILGFVLIREGAGAVCAVLRAGPKSWAYIVFFGVSAPGFVLAVSLTSVANVVLILASMPVFAALFSRLWLGEAISPRMVWTMLGVFAGLGVVLWGSTETEGAHWLGDLVALAVSASFAAALTAVRGLRKRSMLPAVPVAMLSAACLILPFADILAPLATFWPLIVAHGVLMAGASGLMVLGARFLAPAEVSLLILLESILAPFLVWYALGEDPGRWALMGGAIVISALVVSNIVLLRRRSAPANRP